MKRRIVIGVVTLVVIGIITVFIIRNIESEQPATIPSTLPEDTRPVIAFPAPEPHYDPIIYTHPDRPPRSKRISNPSGTHSAYIAPLEWEIVGNLYIKNNKTDEVKRLTNYLSTRSYKPKAHAWFDDTLLLLIEGFSWGTCRVLWSPGGGPMSSDYFSTIPRFFVLEQSYPNPFEQTTEIRYQLPEIGSKPWVCLKIYDVTGRLVRTLINEQQEPGYYTVLWDSIDDLGNTVLSGIYFYCLEAGNFTAMRKMVIM